MVRKTRRRGGAGEITPWSTFTAALGKYRESPTTYSNSVDLSHAIIGLFKTSEAPVELAPPEEGLVAGKSYTVKIPLGGIPDIRNGDTVTYKSTREGNEDEMIYEVTRPSDNDPGLVYYIPSAMATLVPVKGGRRRKTLRRRK